MSDARDWDQRVLAHVVEGHGDAAADPGLQLACGDDDDRHAELELLDELGGLLAAPGVDPASRALALGVLERLDEPEPRDEPSVVPQPSSRWRWVGMAAASAAVLAVALVLVLVWTVPPRDVARPVATVATASGDVRIDGVALGDAPVTLALGSVIEPSGDAMACLHFDLQIDACIGADSSVRIATLDDAEIGLEIVRGRVVAALDPLPHGVHFRLMGGGMRATAVGTALSLEVTDGRAQTAVLEGKVAVDADGQAQSLVAGQRAASRNGRLQVEPLDAESAARDWSLLRHAPLGAARAGQPWADSRSASAELVDDEVPRHTPVPPASEPPTVIERAAVDDAAAGKSAAAKPARRSATRLLADARAALGRGEIREAARTYEELIASHPRTAEAHAACVSVGDLYIGRLGNPRAASRWFRRYLAEGGGSLAPEARHGLVRAARMLGDEAGERSAIEAFVRAHPRDGRAATLRQRLTSMNAAEP